MKTFPPPTPGVPVEDNFRNKIAVKILNKMSVLATANYREFVVRSIYYGLCSAARDEYENRETPEHWTKYVR